MKLEKLIAQSPNIDKVGEGLEEMTKEFANWARFLKVQSKKAMYASEKRRMAQQATIAGMLSDVCKNLQLLL